MCYLVQQYFTESANRFADKVAVSCEGKTISYRHLDEHTNALARALIAEGAKRGDLIGFYMSKSIDAIKSILSILKADCAYIPIDINSPEQRFSSILQASNASIILVDDESELRLKELASSKDINLNQLRVVNVSSFKPVNIRPLKAKNISIDLAYVLFTSGSTGIPKGVMIPHKAIIDYIDWCAETYTLTSEDIISNHAPLYFDNSTFDLYTAFKVGATLHLVHDSLNAVIPKLVSWIKTREISVFFCVPSVLTMLLKSRRLKPDSMKSVRHLICAGEVLPAKTLTAWMETYPHIQFTNMYGPTEITVDCSYYVIGRKPEDEKTIPIGKARANMELFVRTSDGIITQKAGTQGELLVRGTSVAYGYLGDSVKTQAAFIQNPQHNLFHDPLYCTGDLVEKTDDDNFLFLGRADDQIKYLGYRIELGEIEASLNALSEVDEAVVVFNRCEDESERAIGAQVMLKSDVIMSDVIDALRNKLPSYMVPTVFSLSDGEFARTANGKYDRKAITMQVFS